METIKPNVLELFRDLKQIANSIPADYGGGRPLAKSFLMAYVALKYDLKNYVEIGVYRGRSFFPLAYAAKLMSSTTIKPPSLTNGKYRSTSCMTYFVS